MARAQLRTEIPGARTIPTEVRIFRRGINASSKGQFLYDDLAEKLVMIDFRTKGVDCCFDYDHAANAAPLVPAPAAGWFSLEARADGLYAVDIRWTDRARAHLAAAEYRYISPLFSFDETTGRVLSLLNVALVNTPALHDAPALVAASATSPTGGSMHQRYPEIVKKLEALARHPNADRYLGMAEREIDRALMLSGYGLSGLSAGSGGGATAALSATEARVAQLLGISEAEWVANEARKAEERTERTSTAALSAGSDTKRMAAMFGMTEAEWLAIPSPRRTS